MQLLMLQSNTHVIGVLYVLDIIGVETVLFRVSLYEFMLLVNEKPGLLLMRQEHQQRREI
jgi:hypothetical protein